jgi:uncharacterized protein YwlG (UPF0340 family)
MGGLCASESSYVAAEFESGHVASPQRQFVVKLDGIGSEGLGLEVDIGDDVTASITKVLSEGAVPAWNKLNAEGLNVLAGDHIVEVNGIRGSAKELIASIKGGAQLSIVIHRPMEFLAAVRKENITDSVGLDIGYTHIGTTLLVCQVVEGCVKKWNESHPDAAVRRNDRIIEVNGTRGKCKELMAKLTAKDTDLLRLVVTRCDGKSCPSLL